MLEYKREKTILESQLRDVQKRSADHDDHLRAVDGWWSQVSHRILDRVIHVLTSNSCWTK